MRNPFAQKKSLAELQEENEYLETEMSIEQKKAAIRQLKQRGMKPTDFSNNGKASGISWQRIKNFLRI